MNEDDDFCSAEEAAEINKIGRELALHFWKHYGTKDDHIDGDNVWMGLTGLSAAVASICKTIEKGSNAPPGGFLKAFFEQTSNIYFKGNVATITVEEALNASK